MKRVPLHSAETSTPFSLNVVPASAFFSGMVSLSSSQTLYHSFPCKHENSLTPLLLLSPKSLMTFRGPRRSWQNHIPFRRSFSCNRQNKKPIHRDIKNRRWFYSRFKMMFYVTASKFKDGTVCSSVHSLTVPKSIECRRRYFLLAYLRR